MGEAEEVTCHAKISRMLDDVIQLANYALEIGCLPEDVKLSELYQIQSEKLELGVPLTKSEITTIEQYYRTLEPVLTPVTAISLRATGLAESEKINLPRKVKNAACAHALRLWILSFAILAAILGINLYQYIYEFYFKDWAATDPSRLESLTIMYWLVVAITPFMYGAFGASVRLLKVTEERLRDRTFDPRRIAEHRNRLVLGTLSGGAIVMVYSSGGVAETDVKLTEAALGFLAGYSIDLLFTILDRLVNVFTPASNKKSPGARATAAKTISPATTKSTKAVAESSQNKEKPNKVSNSADLFNRKKSNQTLTQSQLTSIPIESPKETSG